MLLVPVILFVAACISVYFIQDSLIFYPTTDRYVTKYKEGIREKYFKINGENIHGWVLREELAAEKLIFFYGGNAEDVYGNLTSFAEKLNACIVLANYRGYGYSTGKPSQDSIIADSEAIYKQMMEKYKPKKFMFFGRSLGSGVASYMASKYEPEALILVTPFDSLENVAKELYPVLPVSLLLNYPFRSYEYLQDFKKPVYVISGAEDRIIKPKRTKALVESLSTVKKLVVLQGANHNNISHNQLFWQELSGIINNI